MAFVQDVLKSLMAKGLTRKASKEIYNTHHNPGSLGPWHARDGMSRQVVRKLKREGGHRDPSYSNGYEAICHRKGHRIGAIPRPMQDITSISPDLLALLRTPLISPNPFGMFY